MDEFVKEKKKRTPKLDTKTKKLKKGKRNEFDLIFPRLFVTIPILFQLVLPIPGSLRIFPHNIGVTFWNK